MILTNILSSLAFLVNLLLRPIPIKKPRSTWTDESFSVDDSDFDD